MTAPLRPEDPIAAALAKARQGTGTPDPVAEALTRARQQALGGVTADNVAGSVLQGVPVVGPWLDEVGNMGRALGEEARATLQGRGADSTVMGRYNALQQAEEERQRAFRAQHPVVDIGTQLVTGLGGAGVAAKAAGAAPAVARTLAQRVGRGALEGAGLGVIAGSGAAGQDNRLAGGLIGGGVGGAAGAVIPVLGEGLTRALRMGRRGAMPAEAATAAPAEAAQATPGTALMRREAVAPVLADGTPSALAAPPAAGRAAAAAASDVDPDVADFLIRKLAQDKRTPQQVLEDIRAMRALSGSPETLVERSGANMRSVVQGLEVMPGEAKTVTRAFVQGRNQRAPTELLQDLQRVMGRSAEDTYQLVDDLVAARAADSRPLYEAAFAVRDVPLTPRLQQILQSAAGRDALARGLRLAEMEQAAGLAPRPTGALMPSSGPSMSLRMLDAVKKGFDDQIARREGAVGGLGPQELRAVSALKSRFLDEVDGILTQRGDVAAPGVSLYARARQVFGSESAVIGAVEEGRGALSMHPNVIRQTLRNMGSEAEREGFRVGALGAYADALAKTPPTGNAAARVGRTPFNKDVLAAIMGDDQNAVSAMEEILARRAGVAETNAMIQGSRTTPAALAAEDVASGLTNASAIGKAADVAGRGVMGNVRDAGRRLAMRAALGGDERRLTNLADQLVKTDGDLEALVQFLIQRGQQGARAQGPYQQAAPLGGAMAGGLAGSGSR